MSRGLPAKKSVPLDEWRKKIAAVHVSKDDMNYLIMNYLVVEGYAEAAKAFQEESGTEPGVDFEALAERNAIRKAVQAGSIEEAIERVNDLNPEILEERQQLSFHLQQQRLIELIRRGAVEEALEFAQEYLAPRGEENPLFLEELEKTLALLAFEDVAASPLGGLLDPSHRQSTASELNAAILSMQSQDPEPRLPLLIKMMSWAEGQLGEKMQFPRMADVTKGALSEPV